MYTGEILFALGITAAVSFVLLVGYLMVSRKRYRLYREILRQETVQFEAFNSTVQIMREGATSSGSLHVVEDPDATDVNIAQRWQRTGPMAEELTVSELTELTDSASPKPKDLDWSPLQGQYEYIEELKGGGMSRIFKALKLNTGNVWIVKFIPKAIGKLTQEADILKSLNHVNLPSIIDIFESAEGQFLVESYIEGVGMDQVFKSHDAIPAFKVLDWAEQIALVLSYLHNLDEKFLHLDLKPSNIMVTHDDRLVLIDFGISRRQSEVAGAVGATISYAAPEQLKRMPSGRGKEIIERRFGELPEERKDWKLDVRTDIYSLGVILFEAAVGHVPQHNHMDLLKKYLPLGLCDIIYKCLEVSPEKRYQRIDQLLLDLQKQKQHTKSKIQFSMMARKAASFASAAAVGLSAFGFTMGNHLMEIEARTMMMIDPELITVSVLQSSEVRLRRFLPDTYEERPINENNLRWELSASHVAQVDGSRIIGLNIGETTIHGQYRHNTVSMQVQVVEPMDGIVEISQRYRSGRLVQLFAGSSHRERLDGLLAQVEFVGPESMDVAENGAIYLADAGVLRRIHNGRVETIRINPPHLRPNLIRTYGNDVFIVTDAWYEEGGFYYGIIRLTASGMEGFFLGDALHTEIRDLKIADGLIYFIEWNAGVGAAYLRTINVNNADDIRTLTEVAAGTSAMAIGDGIIFLADSEEGTLSAYKNGEITHLAGLAGERAFVDGTAPLFYQPSRLRYAEGILYVWDFNVLRKIRLENNVLAEAISLAGAVSTVYDLELSGESEAAERIVLPYSRLMDFIILDEELLISDPKRGVIWSYK